MRACAAGTVAVLAVVLLLPVGIALPAPARAAPLASTPLTTDAEPVPRGAVASPLPAQTPIRLTVSLASGNGAGLSEFLAAVNDPASPLFRHFLTAPEYAQRFGPRADAASTVEASLRAVGATAVGPTPGGLGVQAVVPASGVEALLGVRLESVAGPTAAYTALGSPVLPPSWDRIVSGIGGLSDVRNAALAASFAPVPAARAPLRGVGSEFVNDTLSGAQYAVGSDFAQAYGVSELWNGTLTPDGQYPTTAAIATLLASGYNVSTAQDLPPWDPSVVRAYYNDSLGPGWPVPSLTGVPVTPVGAPTPPLPGPFGDLTDSTENEFENSLDLEMAGSLAPGAALYNFYFAGSLLIGPGRVAGEIADDLADDLGSALNYSYGAQHLVAVSGSFGVPDLNDSLWNTYLGEAAALGVTVVCATGDQGNAPDALTGGSDGPGVLWPASAAFATNGSVAVGGTTVKFAGKATSETSGGTVVAAFDPDVRGLASQTAWYDLDGPTGVAGSEGGISGVYPEPTWQFHSAAQPAIVAAAVTQHATTLGRAEPDVAFPANNTIAYVYANGSGVIFYTILGGTSVAAPVFAGFLASTAAVEAAQGEPYGFGFVTPELYRIGSFFASANGSALAAENPYLDVVTGANNLFAAGPGWDAVTGWGGMAAPEFLAADENATIRDYVYTGPTPGLPHAGPSGPSELEYLLIGVGVLVAATVVVFAARPSRKGAGPPTSVVGATVAGSPYGPVAGATAVPGAVFPCPYCGKDRPAEPVRCPSCGAL
ncbi:MAG TPA: protease pro-enzyme activation domain-containing protein [Thermoplasmata archaeon]|nr:protease pro-enzyme activation domain-containing protein [Thermoplasmata archaeon]